MNSIIATDEICRLCGKDFPRARYGKLSKSDRILRVTGINVKEDEEWLPKYFCHLCYHKLRAGDKKAQHKSGRSRPKLEIPTFIDGKPKEVCTLVQHLDQTAISLGMTVGSDSSIGVYLIIPPGQGDVTRQVNINNEGEWTVKSFGKIVSARSALFSHLPAHLDQNFGSELLSVVLRAKCCTGNSDFPSVLENMRHDYLSSNDKTVEVAYKFNGALHDTNCDLLISQSSQDRCTNCRALRKNLQARSCHLKRKSTMESPSASPYSPFQKLTTPDKKARADSLSSKVHSLQKQVYFLKKRIEDLFERDAIQITDKQTEFLESIVTEDNGQAKYSWPEGSPQRLLWDEQMKRNGTKSAKGMRWHPLMIKWCISLFSSSPKAYRQIGKSGFLHLPSVSTIKNYMRFTKPCPGVNKQVLEFLVKESKVETSAPHQKNVVLIWDEMRIKSGLIMSQSTGRLVGFCASENFSEEMDNLAHEVNGQLPEPELATHIIVFMVRGITVTFNIPFMWFPCCGFYSEDLWTSVWNATRVLENIGLQVRAWTCDGASPNRKFFRIHAGIGGQYQENTYYTINRYDRSRKIYFICDPPHLLKTTRNNLENSHGHHNTKSLVFNGQQIKWSHIVATVKCDKAMQLHRLPRLTEEHIHLSPQLRMRVRLAAQVLSSTMSNALKAEREEYTETANFCEMMDRWFDCLNGRFLGQSAIKRKPELAQYTSENDWRFDWLNNVFLTWLNRWEAEIEGHAELSKSEKNALILSYQTMEGLRITTKSFIELLPELLSESQGSFIFAERFNQDKLEMLFGKVRRSLGDSDNPTVYEAMHRLLALLIAGSTTVMPTNANCHDFDAGQGFLLHHS